MTELASAASIAETYTRLSEDTKLSPYYMAMMGLSGILAAVAMLTNSIPVLIGAMVVAPALPPLALTALALVLGKPRHAGFAFGVAALGVMGAVAGASAATWLLNVTGVLPAEANLVGRELLEERVRPGWYSLMAAVAAGSAGMLASLNNKTDALVGTVAALALVPSGAAAIIALQSGDAPRALGGLVLLSMNVLVIIATGIAVLLLLGRGRRGSKPAS